MKNAFIIIGFILCASASFALMIYSKNSQQGYGEWARNGEHLRHVESLSMSVIDKCKLDKMQGKIKNSYEAAACSKPAIRDAFAKEGFPHMDKVDDFLAIKIENAQKFDRHEISEEDVNLLNMQALDLMLGTALPTEKASSEQRN